MKKKCFVFEKKTYEMKVKHPKIYEMYQAAFNPTQTIRKNLADEITREMNELRRAHQRNKCGPDFNLWTADIKASQVMRCLGDCTLESLKSTEPLVQLQALLTTKANEQTGQE